MFGRIILLMFWLYSSLLHAAILPPGFIETPLATGLDPTAMVQAPDGRIFITEKYGAVRVVENGVLLPDAMIQLTVDNYNERGLSGITLHPNFEQNSWIYLYYTVKNLGRNRLSRYKVFGNYADPASEEILLESDPLIGAIHNGGSMVFGADGKLYVAMGDGADGARAQATNSLLGKVIRLNDDGSIPTDNPYYQQYNGIYRSIYAGGLRNPFSMAIQPGTGQIYIGDVGSEYHEEINELEAGANYGWNILEGVKSGQSLPNNYRDPKYSYSHAIGCAIVGAAFYNPPTSNFPLTYTGKFFFADYCQGYIKVLNPVNGLVQSVFATQIDRPLAIMTGIDGALYYISRGGLGGGSEQDNTSSLEGMLWKVEYVGNGAPVFSAHPKSVLVSAGETATFSVQVNGSTPIQYRWERDNQILPGATGSAIEFSNLSLSDSGAVIRCAAANSFGEVWSQSAMLRVTNNQRPMPMITAPNDDYRYSAGAPFTFAGFATDPETGTLSPDDLSWRIDMHHDAHSHPGLAATPGIENGEFTLPTIGETADSVWIRILLSAKDPAGLSRTVYKDIFPKKSTLRLETNPPGIQVRVDGKTNTTPLETTTVLGLRRLVEAPRLTTIGNKLYVFRSWEDGSEFPVRNIFPQEETVSIRGNYEEIKTGRGIGLLGEYFLDNPSGNFLTKQLQRIDTTVNFDWKYYSPDLRIPNDYFSVRWTGFIEPWFNGEYTFIINSDDGCRLWVNEELLLDAWYPKSEYDLFSTPVTLQGGKRYTIKLEYFEIGGEAAARLFWATPTMQKNVVPKSQLFPLLPEFNTNTAPNLDLFIQPNPFSGTSLSVVVQSTHREQVKFRLVDAAGRTLGTWDKFQIDVPDQLVELPLGQLPQGMYWLEAEGILQQKRTIKSVIKTP